MRAPSELPPLTGSRVLDPWRIRHRLELAGELEPPPRRQFVTPTERMLWQQLEKEPPGWHREYSTGFYRLDFYCPAARLAVEVDGGSHYGHAAHERDELRDAWHLARGITTKRFSVREVETDIGWVMGEIRSLLSAPTRTDEVVQAPAQPRSSHPTEPEPRTAAPATEERAADPLRQTGTPVAHPGAPRHGSLAACLTVLPSAERRLLQQVARLLAG